MVREGSENNREDIFTNEHSSMPSSRCLLPSDLFLSLFHLHFPTGPYQYFWYGALDRAFPGRTLLNFATKVPCLGCCVPVKPGMPCRRQFARQHASLKRRSGLAASHPRSCPHLPCLLQVTLNQLALAPLTISVAFGWNLALQQRLGELPGKLRADFVPTMLNGWKFWVPAATINFTAVPLQYQVRRRGAIGQLVQKEHAGKLRVERRA